MDRLALYVENRRFLEQRGLTPPSLGFTDKGLAERVHELQVEAFLFDEEEDDPSQGRLCDLTLSMLLCKKQERPEKRAFFFRPKKQVVRSGDYRKRIALANELREGSNDGVMIRNEDEMLAARGATNRLVLLRPRFLAGLRDWDLQGCKLVVWHDGMLNPYSSQFYARERARLGRDLVVMQRPHPGTTRQTVERFRLMLDHQGINEEWWELSGLKPCEGFEARISNGFHGDDERKAFEIRKKEVEPAPDPLPPKRVNRGWSLERRLKFMELRKLTKRQ